MKSVLTVYRSLKSFGIPVISGNVSFYNEGKDSAVYPTPVIGMVGLLEDVNKHCTMGFKKEGDLVVLIGENTDELGGSVYLKEVLKVTGGCAPKLNLDKEKKIQTCCLKAIQLGLVKSAHDISEGGLATAIAECCVAGNLGFAGEIETNLRPDVLLFGEGQSRIILSLAEENLSLLSKLAEEIGVSINVLGFVKSGSVEIQVKQKEQVVGKIELTVDKIAQVWNNAIKWRIENVG